MDDGLPVLMLWPQSLAEAYVETLSALEIFGLSAICGLCEQWLKKRSCFFKLSIESQQLCQVGACS